MVPTGPTGTTVEGTGLHPPGGQTGTIVVACVGAGVGAIYVMIVVMTPSTSETIAVAVGPAG